MQPLAVLTPRGMGLEFLVKTFSPSLDIAYLRCVIHYILSKLAMNIEKKNSGSNTTNLALQDYVPIYSKKLLVSHKKHSKHIRFLGETWIGKTNILFREDYCKGKSYSYKLSPNLEDKTLEVNSVKSGVLTGKYKVAQSKLNPVLFSTSGRYKFLGKYFNPELLKIDMEQATKQSQLGYETHRDYNKHLKEMASIVELYNGIYRTYYKCDKDARVHTNITRLNKTLRKYVTYNNKELVEVDLSNSIIYFLAAVLLNRINVDNIARLFPLLYIFNKSLASIDSIEKELIWNLATNGNFYDDYIGLFEQEYTMDKFERLYSKNNSAEYKGAYNQKRKVVKGVLLKMLFAKTDQYKTEQEIFRRKFPTLHNAINSFKKSQGHKKFSHMLMQIESYYMLNITARAFNREFFRVAPIFTLHDCLITTIEHSDSLNEVMRTEFKREFGTAPKMTIEPWC